MANVTFTINDADVPRFQAALCAYVGLPNTAANAKAAVIQYTKMLVREYEQRNAETTARATVADINMT